MVRGPDALDVDGVGCLAENSQETAVRSRIVEKLTEEADVDTIDELVGPPDFSVGDSREPQLCDANKGQSTGKDEAAKSSYESR